MTTTELNKRLQDIVNRLQTLDKQLILEALLQELQTKNDLRDAVRIMAPDYIHKVCVNSSQQETGRSTCGAWDEIKDHMGPGASTKATAETLRKKHPHLNGYFDALERKKAERFCRFGVEYTWATFSVNDMLKIADRYRQVGDANHAIANRYDDVAHDLKFRKVTCLGELSPDALSQYIQRLTKINADASLI